MLALMLVFLSNDTFSQVFWTEPFSNGCNSGCDASFYVGLNGAWTVANTGSNGATANKWYVSGAECGNAAGICGSACGSTDPSLHLGSVAGSTGSMFCPGGDCGAAYDASTANEITNKRAESPLINCTGKSTITLTFNYIEKGQNTLDDASVWYFNGTVWALLSNPLKSVNTGCSGQGKWTAYSIGLPLSANNNANVKLGFNWTNNGDGVGSDPSFAVDDINLSSILLPIELYLFDARCNNNGIEIVWETASELNNDYFTIERSSDANSWYAIEQIKGAGTSNELLKYSYIDFNFPQSTTYYRLKQTDFNGSFAYSKAVAVNCNEQIERPIQLFNNSDNSLTISNIDISSINTISFTLYDLIGNTIIAPITIIPIDDNYKIQLPNLTQGVYFSRILVNNKIYTYRVFVR